MEKINQITNIEQVDTTEYKFSKSLLYLYSLLGFIFFVMVIGMGYFLYYIFN